MTPPASPTWRTITVGDVMHSGVISCSPDTPFHEIAALMAGHAAHSWSSIDWRGLPDSGRLVGAPSQTSI